MGLKWPIWVKLAKIVRRLQLIFSKLKRTVGQLIYNQLEPNFGALKPIFDQLKLNFGPFKYISGQISQFLDSLNFGRI